MGSFNYWCRDRLNHKECSLCGKRGDVVLGEESSKYKCVNNEKVKLKLLGQNTLQISVTKMSTTQIQQDRSKRSREHFKNEILPNIPASTQEGKHFRKKYSKTGK